MDKLDKVIGSRTIDTECYFELIKDLLNEGSEVKMTPKGSSMLPFIRGGRDSVALIKLDRPLEVGDIVLADIGKRYVMHRVFAVEGDSVVLMGDGNLQGKESCGVSDVIGLVRIIYKNDRKALKPAKGRLWRLMLPVRRYLLAIYKRILRCV